MAIPWRPLELQETLENKLAASLKDSDSKQKIYIKPTFLLIRIVLLPSALCRCYNVAAKHLAHYLQLNVKG